MIFIQLIIVLLFVAVLVTLTLTALFASQKSPTKKIYGKSPHAQLANISFWLALSAIILTEVFVRLKGGSKIDTQLYIHLSFALPFFASLTILRFWITGIKNKWLHKCIAYICILTYLGTFITGMQLLFKGTTPVPFYFYPVFIICELIYLYEH